jgi:hypothetical protein
MGRSLFACLGFALLASAGPVVYHTETKAVAGGAELVTVFADSLPMLTVLRDSVPGGDLESTKLRQVWLLTYARPTLTQRLAAAIPFLLRRSHHSDEASPKLPHAVLDLSSPRKTGVVNVFSYVAQTEVLDVVGVPVRATSRTYRGNSSEYQQMHLAQAFETLSNLDGTRASDFSEQELETIAARLALDKKLLGDFVSDRRLDAVYDKDRTEADLHREHNWEVLRQRAESNGLYFQPLNLGQQEPAQAMLWIAQSELQSQGDRNFDGKLLNIRNPWNDDRLRNWQGYGERWYLDADNRRVTEDTPGAVARDMIPLALYSLSYPREPLLLVDFRNDWNPKRGELIRRVAETTASGFLGWNGLANLEYFAGKQAWHFVQGRHGQPENRAWRVDAYAQLRQQLTLDPTLNADLKRTITNQLDRLALNPFETELKAEVSLANRQYTALMQWADDPNGLPRMLERERGSELVALEHDRQSRAWLTAASVATFGIYRHRESVTPEALAELERNRRIEARLAYLQHVLDAGGPRIDVSYDMEPVRKAVKELADLDSAPGDPRIGPLVRRVSAHTGDAVPSGSLFPGSALQ